MYRQHTEMEFRQDLIDPYLSKNQSGSNPTHDSYIAYGRKRYVTYGTAHKFIVTNAEPVRL